MASSSASASASAYAPSSYKILLDVAAKLFIADAEAAINKEIARLTPSASAPSNPPPKQTPISLFLDAFAEGLSNRAPPAIGTTHWSSVVDTTPVSPAPAPSPSPQTPLKKYKEYKERFYEEPTVSLRHHGYSQSKSAEDRKHAIEIAIDSYGSSRVLNRLKWINHVCCGNDILEADIKYAESRQGEPETCFKR